MYRRSIIRLVYIAATDDLRAEQDALKEILNRLRDVKAISRSDIGGSPAPLVVAVLQEVAYCDLFVCLVGISDCPIESKISSSIEYEYFQARAAGVDCLAYFYDGGPVTNPAILIFREQVANDVRICPFTTVDSLVIQCMVDLSRLILRNPDGPVMVKSGQAGEPTVQTPREDLTGVSGVDEKIKGLRWILKRPWYIKYPLLSSLPFALIVLVLFKTETLSFPKLIGHPFLRLIGQDDPVPLVGEYSDDFRAPGDAPSKYFWYPPPPRWKMQDSDLTPTLRALRLEGPGIGLFVTPGDQQPYDFKLLTELSVQSGQTGVDLLMRANPRRTKYYCFKLLFPANNNPASLVATAEPGHRLLTHTKDTPLHQHIYPPRGKITLDITAVDNEFKVIITFEDPRLSSDNPPPGLNDTAPRENDFRDELPASQQYKFGQVGFEAAFGPVKIESLDLKAKAPGAAQPEGKAAGKESE